MLQTLESIPLAILLPVIIIEAVLLIVALIDCIRIDKTNGPKWLWVIIIIFFTTLGPILYFILGRKHQV